VTKSKDEEEHHQRSHCTVFISLHIYTVTRWSYFQSSNELFGLSPPSVCYAMYAHKSAIR
jgi:hypothetical protein